MHSRVPLPPPSTGTCGVPGAECEGFTVLRLLSTGWPSDLAQEDTGRTPGCAPLCSHVDYTAEQAGWVKVKAGCWGSSTW